LGPEIQRQGTSSNIVASQVMTDIENNYAKQSTPRVNFGGIGDQPFFGTDPVSHAISN
jgi:hypothetical protein